MNDRLNPAKDFDINKFEYTQLVKLYKKQKKNEIKAKNDATREWNNKNRSKKRKKIIAVHENSIMSFAVKSVDAFILHLKKGSANDRREAKLLETERAYIRKMEKDELASKIVAALGGGVGGEYSLNETGLALGFTRQRAEQIEKEARRKIKQPKVGKILRGSMYA